MKTLLPALVLAAAASSASAQYSTPMRDVENPDRSAFQINASGVLDPPFVNGFVFVPTPLGKRYFIEYITMSCALTATDTITQVFIGTRQSVTTGSLGFSSHGLVLTRRGPGPFGGTIWTGSAAVKLYSDPDNFSTDGGTNISFNVFHTEAASRGSCSVYVSGHTLPL